MIWLLKFQERKKSFENIKKKDSSKKSKAKNHIEFFLLILFFILIREVSSGPNNRKENSNFSFNSHLNEITIKIKDKGNQYIVSEKFYLCPDKIYLNENPDPINPDENNCRIIYIPLESYETNTIKLIWDNKLITLHSLFENLTNLVEADLSNLDSSSVAHMTQIFLNCVSLTSINLANLNTSLVEDMHMSFCQCNSLAELDLSSFDTSKVKTMYYMFQGCKNLKTLNLANFDTSQVETMEAMFNDLDLLETLDISNFDTSKVNNMNNMFFHCEKLKILDLSHFNTSNVLHMGQMFRDCKSLISLDVSNFDTSKVTIMGFMFFNCEQLPVLNLSSFRTPNVEDMNEFFWNCKVLTSLDISNFDTSKIKTMYGFFAYCEKLKELDLSHFRTPSCENMEYVFIGCKELTFVNITNFDASKSPSLTGMFYDCYALSEVDMSNFNTQNVKSMLLMFHYCVSLTSLDLSSFNTESIENLQQMFYHCHSLSSLDLSNFHTPNLNAMSNMFDSCQSLTSLDISHLNTEHVNSMQSLFYDCNHLRSLNLSSFNTANVENMNIIFYNCQSLTSLDLSNFDTSKVTNMGYIFCHCYSLRNLNLGDFKTNSVTNMDGMFANCISLTTLDLTSFDTSIVTSMQQMLFNCNQLTEIDLSSFDTSSLKNFGWMFQYCSKMEYINFNRYDEKNSIFMDGVLEQIRENIVVCIDESNKSVYNFKLKILAKVCPRIYCGNDWRNHIRKYDPETRTCPEDCHDYKYENDNKCYSTCPEGADFCQPGQDEIETSYIDTTNNLKIGNNIATTNMVTTENLGNDNNIATTNLATTNMLKTDNTENNIGTTNIVKADSFEEKNSLESNISPSTDNLNENTNSLTNKDEENKNIYSTTILSNLISSSPTLLLNLTYENNEYEEIENINQYNITGNNNQRIYLEIKEMMNKYKISKKDNIIIKAKDNFIYQITTTENEKDSLNDNNSSSQISRIDLGECENLLKDFYHINKSVPLIIMKFEKITNNTSERNLLYEIYEPFNKTKLDLSICNKTEITVYTKVELSDELLNLYNQLKDMGYDLFDINNDFYKDICVPFTSPQGTDVTLEDRKNYFFNNNETLCQPNCKFNGYSVETKLLKCKCDLTNSEIETKIIKKTLTKETAYESFYDTLRFSNYKVLWCYKLAFHINSVTINKGSIIAIIFFCFYFIFLIIYGKEGIRQLKIHFARLIFKKNIVSSHSTKNDNQIIDVKQNNISRNRNELEKRDLRKRSTAKSLTKLFDEGYNNFPPKKSSLKENAYSKRHSSKHANKKVIVVKEQRYSDKNLLVNNKLSSKNRFSETTEKNNIRINTEMNENIEEESLDNYELNNLEFDKALELDKRSFIATYWSKLRREHLILFTFFVRNDYNLTFVKYSRFIFIICTDMAVNVFFFSDNTMHKIYVDYGKYNFIQQIPQIVISTVVSQMLEVFLCFLSMTDKHYYEIKELGYENRYEVFKIMKCIKIKLTFYFIFTFLLFAFYWYAIACFCAVYPNTQMAFITDSFSSFILGLLYPFVLYLFPTIFRIISLRASKSNLSCLYSLSDIIPFF